jgi:hypothetical protein
MTPAQMQAALAAARRHLMDGVSAIDAENEAALAPLADVDRVLHEVEDALMGATTSTS